jgi:hypothetical protein
MKHLLLLFVLICASASADIITNGVAIDSARRALRAAGHRETALDMLPSSTTEQLEFWNVGQGVLIISFSKASGSISGLQFLVSDERPKATRKTFDFEVMSFDSETGLIVIRTIKDRTAAAPRQEGPTGPRIGRTP